MRRLSKLIVIFVIVFLGISLWEYWIYPSVSEKRREEIAQEKINSEKDRRLGGIKQEKIDKAQKEKKAAEKAIEKAKQAAKKVKLESPSYKRGARDGWAIGFATGRNDALSGRARRGLWAKKTAEQFVSGKKDNLYREAYIKNAHEGYNEGWHHQMKVLEKTGLKIMKKAGLID